MIEQAKLWFADAWTFQEKLGWAASLLIILLFILVIAFVSCWEMTIEEFDHAKKTIKGEPDETGKL